MQRLVSNRIVALFLGLLVLLASSPASAAEGSFLSVFLKGGFMMVILLIVSIAGFAFAFQALVSMRAHLLRPPELANELINCCQEGNLDAAVEAAQNDGSFLGSVAYATLSSAQFGKEGMETAMADAGEIEANKLLNKIGLLQLIAAISPMLGLTGTIVGMIMTFAKIHQMADQVTASDMAEGISVALVTTFVGLMVAIPLLCIAYFLKSRVSQSVLEISNDCNEMVRVVTSGEQVQR